jgi:hypothetical protein
MGAKEQAQSIAMNYRDYWNEHPKLALGLGLVPVAGQIIGLADAAASYADPRADALERGLSTIGILPFGKGVKAAKRIFGSGSGLPDMALGIMGPAGKKRALANGVPPDRIVSHFDDELKAEVSEIVPEDGVTDALNEAMVNKARKANKPLLVRYGDLRPNDPYLAAHPEMANMKVKLVPGQDPGGGSYLMNPNTGGFDPPGSKQYRMTVGVGNGGLAKRGELSSMLDATRHEGGHAVHNFEVDAGTFPNTMRGADPDTAGQFGYFGNHGEQAAESMAHRADWTADERMAVSPMQHRNAMRQLQQTNVDQRQLLNLNSGYLRQPSIVEGLNRKANLTGGTADITQAQRRGKPAFKAVEPNRKEGEWGDTMSIDDLVDMEPRLGQKMGTMRKDESWSARYKGDTNYGEGKGPKRNYAKELIAGKEIEPAVVHVRWDSNAGQWHALNVDGIRRTVALRNLYGPNVKMPVIFKPHGTISKDAKLSGEAFLGADVQPHPTLNADDFATYGPERPFAKGRGW